MTVNVPTEQPSVLPRCALPSDTPGHAAAASFLVQRNSVPSTHMRCMMTASRRATATIARFMPRCRAIFMPQALSHDHLRLWVIRTRAASNNVSRIRASPHFEMPPIRSISPDCCRHGARPKAAPTAFELLKREGEIEQGCAEIVLDVERLGLQKLATGQQHAALLAGQRLHMHRSVQANTHHLCNAARIIAVALVDLCRQRRLHMPGLNTDHRQTRFSQCAVQPLR